VSYARGMEGLVGAPPQRVCPQCARISWATGPQCPYCTARFSRRPGIAPWMLVATAAVVLLGVGIMFFITVQQVNARVDEVNSEINRNFNTLRSDVRKELDARIPPGGLPTAPPVTPTPTPFPTETPTPDPGTEITPDPTIEPEITPDATATESPTEEIRP